MMPDPQELRAYYKNMQVRLVATLMMTCESSSIMPDFNSGLITTTCR
jgi:hypothetical protein